MIVEFLPTVSANMKQCVVFQLHHIMGNIDLDSNGRLHSSDNAVNMMNPLVLTRKVAAILKHIILVTRTAGLDIKACPGHVDLVSGHINFCGYVPDRASDFQSGHVLRHRENFWAFTGPKTDFGRILLILNMIIHRSFTGPTHLLSANVLGPVSFTVSVYLFSQQCTWPLQFTGLVQILAGHMKIFAGHVNLQNHVPDGNVNQILNVKPWTVVNSEWLNGQGMDSESYWTHWPLNDAVVILN